MSPIKLVVDSPKMSVISSGRQSVARNIANTTNQGLGGNLGAFCMSKDRHHDAKTY